MKYTERDVTLAAGWHFIDSFGFSAEIYARGTKRRIIDRETGAVITEYETTRHEATDAQRNRD